MDIELQDVKKIVDQAISYKIFHSLDEDIQNALNERDKAELEQLAQSIKSNHKLEPTEVFRVVLDVGNSKKMNTIYLNQDSLEIMMSRQDNYLFLKDMVDELKSNSYQPLEL